jgi:selenocysteine lyase/cysteine desulfurase
LSISVVVKIYGEAFVKINRRNWLARAAAGVYGSSFYQRLAAQSLVTSQLPARSDFPITQTTTFLNNAYWHPLSSGAMSAVEGYLQRKATGSTRISYTPAGDQVKAKFAELINAQPSAISFVPSTVVGENLVVAGMDIRHSPGNVVTDALHYESSTYLYRSLQAQGVDVHFVKPRDGRIEMADIERAVDRNTKLVSVSLVSYLNGFQHDLKAVCDLAHSHGAYVYADLVQAAGAVPIDVRKSGVDFCACGSHKWLMGDMGLGFLYVREDLLDRVIRRAQFGSRQITDYENHIFPFDLTSDGAASWKLVSGTAGHFEIGTISQTTVAALSYSLPYIQRLGVERIQAHAQSLTGRLQVELPRLGFPSVTPPDTKSPIVTFVVKEPRAIAARLEKANVDVKIDQHLMRVSPSIYNDQADIDKLLNALS